MDQRDALNARPSGALPMRQLCRLAALGTIAAVALVLMPLLSYPQGMVGLIEPGTDGPAARIMRADFPGLTMTEGSGHDGQEFYAIAREPSHLSSAAESLDRPRYRAQRILFPLLAWALHPTGGGTGLVVALFVVGVAGLFVGGVAFGALSLMQGGRASLAAVFPLLPGALASLNLSVPDALALALVLAAIALDQRGNRRAALVTAVAAALTKESLLLVLVGYALWRRDRRGALLAGIPIAAAATWWGILRLTLDSTTRQVHEFDPLHGLWVAARDWVHGEDLGAACVFVLAVVLGIVALRRGALHRPFGWAIALQLGFVATLGANVLATGSNGYRALLPLLALSVLDMTSRPTNVSSPRAALASTR